MRTKTQILPGVSRIGWLDCRFLAPYVSLQYICGMKVSVMTDIHFIPEFEDASCECSTKVNGAGLSATASLKFRTNALIPDNGYLAFVVTTPCGENYLIGSQERPYATMECDHSTGDPSADASGYEYEIKHIAIRSMIPCVIGY